MGKVAWAYKAISYHLLLLVVMEKKNHFSLKLRFSPIDKAGFLFQYFVINEYTITRPKET